MGLKERKHKMSGASILPGKFDGSSDLISYLAKRVRCVLRCQRLEDGGQNKETAGVSPWSGSKPLLRH